MHAPELHGGDGACNGALRWECGIMEGHLAARNGEVKLIGQPRVVDSGDKIDYDISYLHCPVTIS